MLDERLSRQIEQVGNSSLSLGSICEGCISELISRKMIEGQITALIRKCVYRIERMKNQLFLLSLCYCCGEFIQRHSEDKN